MPTELKPAETTPCYACRGTLTTRWHNANTGRTEDWPCIVCRPTDFDAKEAAEGLALVCFACSGSKKLTLPDGEVKACWACCDTAARPEPPPAA